MFDIELELNKIEERYKKNIEIFDSMPVKLKYFWNTIKTMRSARFDLIQQRVSINKNNCWNWIKFNGENKKHRMLALNKKLYSIHRLSYSIFYGEFLNTLKVCHKCDNPKCFNPDHLFLGTSQDNFKDMKKKGRHCGAKKMNNPEFTFVK